MKIRLVLLIAIFTFLLSGCGNSQNTSPSNTQSTEAIETVEPTEIRTPTPMGFIAYSIVNTYDKNGIYILDFATGEKKLILPESDLVQFSSNGNSQTASVGKLEWSPDGTKVLFLVNNVGFSRVRQFNNNGIYIVNADGSNAQKLAGEPDLIYPDATWSKTGDMIYYLTYQYPINQLSRMDTNGQNIELVCDDIQIIDFDLSPDGNQFAYSTGVDVGVMNVDCSGMKTIKTFQGELSDVEWSADGSYIYGISADFDINQNSLNAVNTGLFRIKPDGSDYVRLTDTPGIYETRLSLSPEGKMIAMASTGLNDQNGYLLLSSPEVCFNTMVKYGNANCDNIVLPIVNANEVDPDAYVADVAWKP